MTRGNTGNDSTEEWRPGMIRDADAAMYQAKQQGKNWYVFSDQSNIPREELLERWKRVAQTNWMLRER